MFSRQKRGKEPPVAEVLHAPHQPVQRTVPEIFTMCYTSMGNRKYQQDAVFVSPGKKLAANKKIRVMAAVCDGMGGMADGGRASSTAIEMLKTGFARIEKEAVVDVPAFFTHGIKAMDQVICEFPKENGKGSGTTMVAVIVEDHYLYWASVGDSRIYILRGDQIHQITRDHNYMLRLQEMVAAGEITMEQAQAHKQKEALISFLGIGDVRLMDISQEPIELQLGDIVLLCSDGITKTLPDEQIQKIIMNDMKPMEEKAQLLVGAAIRGNTHSQDNTSVAILQYKETIISKTKGE